jgi:hypothetical protein
LVSTTPCRVTPPLGARAPAHDGEYYTPYSPLGLVARLCRHKGAQTSIGPSQSPSRSLDSARPMGRASVRPRAKVSGSQTERDRIVDDGGVERGVQDLRSVSRSNLPVPSRPINARFCEKPNGKISVSLYCQSIKEPDLCTCYSTPWGPSFQPHFSSNFRQLWAGLWTSESLALSRARSHSLSRSLSLSLDLRLSLSLFLFLSLSFSHGSRSFCRHRRKIGQRNLRRLKLTSFSNPRTTYNPPTPCSNPKKMGTSKAFLFASLCVST